MLNTKPSCLLTRTLQRLFPELNRQVLWLKVQMCFLIEPIPVILIDELHFKSCIPFSEDQSCFRKGKP